MAIGFTEFLKTIDLFGRTVNLRFMGRDQFNTRCGGVSTLIMFLTLTIIFGLGVYDVYTGELHSFNSMILNIHNINESSSTTTLARAIKQKRVLAFGIDSPVIDESYLKITAQHEVGKNLMDMENQLYNCSEVVYSNLINGLKAVVPTNLKIMCLNVSAYDLDRGIKPSVTFSICKREKGMDGLKNGSKGVGGGCKPWKEVKKSLRRLDIWAFTLADSTNYASAESFQRNKFTASRIPISYRYQKMARLTLRKMRVESTEGAFFQQKKITSTVAFLSSEQQITSSYREKDILHLLLRVDRNSKVLIKRKYKSIFSLFAYIGGLSRGMAMVFAILVFPVREVLYYQNLINNMFNVCLDHKQKEIALKTMFPEDEAANDSRSNNDSDGGGHDGGGGDGGQSARRKERSRRKTENGFYRRMMRNNTKGRMPGGLFDDFIGKMTSDEIFKNMEKAINQIKPEDIKGKKGFGNLLMKGLNIRSRTKKIKRLKTQPHPILANGEYRDLTDEEKSLLMSDTVQLRLKKWHLRAKTKVIKNSILKFEKEKESLEQSITTNRKKMIGRMLTNRSNKSNKLSVGQASGSGGHLRPPGPGDSAQHSLSSSCQVKPRGTSRFKLKMKSNGESSGLRMVSMGTLLKLGKPIDSSEDVVIPKSGQKSEPHIPKKSSREMNRPQGNEGGQNPENLLQGHNLFNSFQKGFTFSEIEELEQLDCETQIKKSSNPFKGRIIVKKNLNPGERVPPNRKVAAPIEMKNLSFGAIPQTAATKNEQKERESDQKQLELKSSILLQRVDSDAGGGIKIQQPAPSTTKNDSKTAKEPKTEKTKILKFSPLKLFHNKLDELDDQESPKQKPTFAKKQLLKKNVLADLSPSNKEEDIPPEDDSAPPVETFKNGINNVMKGIMCFGNKIIGGGGGIFSRTKSKKKTETAMYEKKVKENNKKLEELKKKNQMLYKNEALLTFSASFKDMLLFWVPNWVSGVYPKKELFTQGMEMIRSKLEVGSIITGMNELEKLKSLLFDQNQYYLFQNIQKPFLIGFDIIEDPKEPEETQDCSISEEKEVKIETGEAEVKIGSETKTAKFSKKTSSYKINFKRKKNNKKKKPEVKRKQKHKFSVLLSNQSFWNKDNNVQQNVENFEKALDAIKSKGNDQNVIDKRLLNYFSGVFGS